MAVLTGPCTARMASFQPNQEGINQIVGLLTEVHKPGANQSEVRAWSSHLGPPMSCSSRVLRPLHRPSLASKPCQAAAAAAAAAA